jgi:hypothetical protein
VKQIEKLQDVESLGRVRDKIQEKLEISSGKIKSDRWIYVTNKFLDSVKKQLDSSPFEVPVCREELEELTKINKELNAKIESLVEEKYRLVQINTDLKKTKDKDDVAEVERKHSDRNKLDKFKRLCKEVSKLISEFPGIVNGVIFSDYSDKELPIRGRSHEAEVIKAKAQDIIVNDQSFPDLLAPNWDTNPKMQDLLNVLNKLSGFIGNSEADERFMAAYHNEFKAPLSLSNSDFWMEAFEIDINFD